MNITNLIVSLQQAASKSSVTALDCMALSKIIEKLKVGDITTVANTAALPSTLTTNGNMFYVTADEDLYYNVGSTWKPLTQVFNYAYGWGTGSGGLHGDGLTSAKSSPTIGGIGVTTWSQVDIWVHGVGVTAAGIAYGWGYNTNGQLGDGTTTNRSSPVTVIGGITNWSQVAAGRTHSLGITSSGIAYGWGFNNYGRLGNASTTATSSPVTVVGGFTNWSRVSGGLSHSLGLRASGVLYGWGQNANGQLGDNTTSSRLSPVTVVGGITTWSRMVANLGNNSRNHSLGVTTGGLAYSWGYNQQGQLGTNNTSARSSPVTVVGGITTWSQVSAGNFHSLGLTSTGIAYGWGGNTNGAVGDNSTTSRSSPVSIVGGITNWSQISAGTYHSVGLTATGVLYGWGNDGAGQLGQGTTANRSSPVSVVGGITSWTQIDGGSNATMAIAAVSV